MNGHYTSCDICGSPGHKAKSCGVRQLEARKDPFGEELRRQAYRDRARRPILTRTNVQTSPRFGS